MPKALFRSRPWLAAALLLGILRPASAERTWTFIPVALVNPENGLGLGLKFIDRAFRSPGEELDLHVYGTTKGQYEIKAEHLRRGWGGTPWRTRAEAETFYYPESWFGSGNHPRDADEQIYTPLGVRGTLEAAYALPRGFRVEGSLRARHVAMEDPESADGGPADPAVLGPQLTGYPGGTDDLLGLAILLDTRDDESLPSRGWHAGHRAAHGALGLDYAYGLQETWLAAYAAPHPRWELAAQAFQETAWGDVPFYALPHLGDKRRLRGIPEKRLRDRSAQALQAEARWSFRLRLPLIARWFGDQWQVAAFGGAGRVGGDFLAASREELHFAGGLGGRLLLGERLAAVRGDLGVSRFGFGLYVDFNQAF